ncbi:hypothetical protein ABXW19_11895, partial [Streptococcus suis]|uniref:hypothetical protein n=1 Tax=Streptococcus suis TaxID=1307 RepID=UPI003CE778FA
DATFSSKQLAKASDGSNGDDVDEPEPDAETHSASTIPAPASELDSARPLLWRHYPRGASADSADAQGAEDAEYASA